MSTLQNLIAWPAPPCSRQYLLHAPPIYRGPSHRSRAFVREGRSSEGGKEERRGPRKKKECPDPPANTVATANLRRKAAGVQKYRGNEVIGNESTKDITLDHGEEEREQAYISQCVAVMKKREEREESIALQADMTSAADERAKQVGIGFAYYNVVQGRRKERALPFVCKIKEKKKKEKKREKWQSSSRYVLSFLRATMCDRGEQAMFVVSQPILFAQSTSTWCQAKR